MPSNLTANHARTHMFQHETVQYSSLPQHTAPARQGAAAAGSALIFFQKTKQPTHHQVFNSVQTALRANKHDILQKRAQQYRSSQATQTVLIKYSTRDMTVAAVAHGIWRERVLCCRAVKQDLSHVSVLRLISRGPQFRAGVESEYSAIIARFAQNCPYLCVGGLPYVAGPTGKFN